MVKTTVYVLGQNIPLFSRKTKITANRRNCRLRRQSFYEFDGLARENKRLHGIKNSYILNLNC